MRTATRILAVAAGVFVITTAQAMAQATDTVTVSATVSTSAKLSLSSNTSSFPDADPDTTPSITAAPITVTSKGKTSAGSAITLTVQSDGDLTAGGATIPVSNVTWTTSGSGYSAGTMNSAAAQTLGSWTNSGNRPGSQTYALANSWDYATGAYSMVVTYTLTAP